MAASDLSYVHFHERQFLRAEDLTAEQVYHLTMRWRHNIAHHVWGIVRGLELSFDAETLSFAVQPGLAVDGYGREVILRERWSIATTAFEERASDALDVLMTWTRIGSERVPRGYAACDEEAGRYYRWLEQPALWLTIPNGDPPRRRQPPSVPPGDWTFDPQRVMPVDPSFDWPIWLGQIRRQRVGDRWQFAVDPSGRPYAGLVGWRVEDPGGQGWIEIGAEGDTDRRFAIHVPEAGALPRLEIDRQGAVGIRGDVTLDGDLTVAGGTIALEAGAEPLAAAPWRIYHVRADSAGGGDPEELRIEMASGSGGRNRVTIGAWDPDNKEFAPCLTVTDEGHVRIDGDLIVQGRIVEPTHWAAVTLSDQAQHQAVAAFLSGVAAAPAQVTAPRELLLAAASAFDVAAALTASREPTMRAFAASLNNPVDRRAFVELLRRDEFSDLRAALRDELADQGPR